MYQISPSGASESVPLLPSLENRGSTADVFDRFLPAVPPPTGGQMWGYGGAMVANTIGQLATPVGADLAAPPLNEPVERDFVAEIAFMSALDLGVPSPVADDDSFSEDQSTTTNRGRVRRTIICPTHLTVFSTRQELNYHINKEHSRGFNCLLPGCSPDNYFKDIRTARQHIKHIHGQEFLRLKPRSFKCGHCEKLPGLVKRDVLSHLVTSHLNEAVPIDRGHLTTNMRYYLQPEIPSAADSSVFTLTLKEEFVRPEPTGDPLAFDADLMTRNDDGEPSPLGTDYPWPADGDFMSLLNDDETLLEVSVENLWTEVAAMPPPPVVVEDSMSEDQLPVKRGSVAPRSKVIICPTHLTRFATREELNIHIKKEHSHGFSCLRPGCSNDGFFKSVKAMREHVKSVHGQTLLGLQARLYECGHCDRHPEPWPVKRNAVSHIVSKHLDRGILVDRRRGHLISDMKPYLKEGIPSSADSTVTVLTLKEKFVRLNPVSESTGTRTSRRLRPRSSPNA